MWRQSVGLVHRKTLLGQGLTIRIRTQQVLLGSLLRNPTPKKFVLHGTSFAQRSMATSTTLQEPFGMLRNQHLMTSLSENLACKEIPAGGLGVVGHAMQQFVQQLSVLADMLEQTLWQMSSTLKKRKAKMNKHKLRKRRKKERRKSK